MSLTIAECSRCDGRFFPVPLVCTDCHATNLRLVPAESGMVELVTKTADAKFAIATVLVGETVRVVARVPADARLGAQIGLCANADENAGFVPQVFVAAPNE